MRFWHTNYFDNAATTPVDPLVAEGMLPYFVDQFGNASSVHGWGLAAEEAVEKARNQVAALVGASDPAQILFTSGATESNNWALMQGRSIAVSPFEHSAVLEPARRSGAEILGNDGFELRIPNQPVDLVSVMTVNNEVGAWLELPQGIESKAGQVHRDMTQQVGKFPVDLSSASYASFSAHKFYGPKGVGCLYAEDPFGLTPMILGGEQQHGMRGGTLNVPGIVGMGIAAQICMDRMEEDEERARSCRSAVLEGLGNSPNFVVNGGPQASPYVLSLSFEGIEGEALALELDRRGYGVSSGAACSSRSTDPSHVLLAMKVPSELLRGTIRVSFGRFNTRDSAFQLGVELRGAADTLRNLRTI